MDMAGDDRAKASRPIKNLFLRRLWMAKMLATIRIRNSRGFMFEGERYHFLFHRYNCTWINERQVEVPVLRRSARGVRHDEVLEVGNVLSHYGRVRHRVVDKYERARGVSNEDFLHHRPPNPYRLILSISTFEHIGWDEADRDPRKFLLAVRHAQGLLAPGGLLALTVPLGYNPEVDRFVASPPDGFKVRFLERFGPLPGHWRQADRCTGETHPYDPAGKASGIAVILHRAPAGRR